MKRALVALNIEMSWKVYHKLVHSDKQEGGALLMCGSSTASPAAREGPAGHSAGGSECESISPTVRLLCCFKRGLQHIPWRPQSPLSVWSDEERINVCEGKAEVRVLHSCVYQPTVKAKLNIQWEIQDFWSLKYTWDDVCADIVFDEVNQCICE